MKVADLTDLAERLRGIAALGLTYADDRYDRERYEDVRTVAMELLSAASGVDVSELEPLRSTTFAHPTPFVGADALVLDHNERVLLIRRSDNGLWAMPGGFSDVGETPGETAVREAREETGVDSEPVALAGVFDSRYSKTPGGQHIYHLVVVCRARDEVLGDATHGHEVLDAQWFPQGDLPHDLDPGHAFRLPIALDVWRGATDAYFDKG